MVHHSPKSEVELQLFYGPCAPVERARDGTPTCRTSLNDESGRMTRLYVTLSSPKRRLSTLPCALVGGMCEFASKGLPSFAPDGCRR